MKFVNYMEKISGVNIYALGSLMIFTLFFAVMLIWLFRSDKRTLNTISRIPLDQ